MKVISRCEAVAAGLLRYFTGKPCKGGHVAERQTRNGTCLVCQSERTKRYAKANRAAIRARRRNKPEGYSAKARARQVKWNKNNRHRLAAYGRSRAAAKMWRTPLWAELDKIAKVYLLAEFVAELTGAPHHVDHEIPLQGKLVSGLHVHTNLRVLSRSENVRKGNSFKPYAEHYAPEYAVALIPC